MKKVAARLLVLGIGLLVALALCEVVVRVARPQPVYLGRDELPPSVRLPAKSYTSVTPEWRNRIEINALGFHDREHAFERSGDGLRLLIAGDSFSEAAQLPIDQVWWSLAGEWVADELGRPVEVINCGMAGVGTATEWATYRALGRRYEADVVLLPIYLENDVVDNSHALQGGPEHGLFYELVDGELREMGLPPTSGRGDSLAWRASHLARFVGRLLYVRAEAAKRIQDGGGYPRDLQIYLERPPPAWQDAWELTGALVEALAEDVTADGAILVATLIPGKLLVHEEHWDALLDAYPAMGEERWDTAGPGRSMAAILDRANVPYLDLLPVLREAATAEPLYYEADIHWTAEGNRVAGVATAGLIAEAVSDDEADSGGVSTEGLEMPRSPAPAPDEVD